MVHVFMFVLSSVLKIFHQGETGDVQIFVVVTLLLRRGTLYSDDRGCQALCCSGSLKGAGASFVMMCWNLSFATGVKIPILLLSPVHSFYLPRRRQHAPCRSSYLSARARCLIACARRARASGRHPISNDDRSSSENRL